MKIDIAPYHAAGLSVIPIDDKKVPIGSWKEDQKAIREKDFSIAHGIGVVCGAVSGNLQAVDLDLKYDLTGTLKDRYKELINSCDPTILPKLVIQKTRSNGYHLIFKCPVLEKNTKYARRPTTEEEKKGNPNDKVRVLIETRDEGGYIAIAPTAGYSFVQGDIFSVQEITPEQRDILKCCARELDEVPPEPVYFHNKNKNEEDSAVKAYNDEGGNVVLPLLEKHGWKIVERRGRKTHVLRPGDTKARTSGNFDHSLNMFSVFSTSTGFDEERGYAPAWVFGVLECGKNWPEVPIELGKRGYGKTFAKQTSLVPASKIAITEAVQESELPYISTREEVTGYLDSWRKGTFVKGLSWGIPELDAHHLLKRGSFNIINGLDNTGKSLISWYLALLSALYHGWKWAIYSCENSEGTVWKRLIELYWGEQINRMNEAKYKVALKFVQHHFKILKTQELSNYMDVLNMAYETNRKYTIDGVIIDPYNGLREDIPGNKSHEYHYQAASTMKMWGKSNNITLYVNCHAVTKAMREKDAYGNPAAPHKADTEGGTKWAAKADDFLTIHRLVYSNDEWMNTQIHVRKVKETETGGRCTPLAEPVILCMEDQCRFVSKRKLTNPVADWHKNRKPVQTEISIPTPMKVVKPNNGFVDFSSSSNLKDSLPGEDLEPLTETSTAPF